MTKRIQEYWNNGLIYNLKSRIHNRTKLGSRLIVDMEMYTKTVAWWNGYEMERTTINAIERTDQWTDIGPEELQKAGYKKVTGLYDSIVWWNVPVYLAIHGGKKYDVHQTDERGMLIYSQDTSATLHDAMQSNATQAFIKGMGKTQLASMDIQKIFMIGILAVGALFGLYMLGVI